MVKPKERLISLDAFRGLTIAGMILVNNPGSWSNIYDPLEHAAWNGWTPTDLVFPFFLFIVGVAMTYSFNSMERRGVTKREIYKRIFRRSALLFGIGLFMVAFPFFRLEPFRLYDFSSIRIMGVLQRIALCYLFASVIFLEFRNSLKLAGWATGILFFYWVIMTTVPVPGGSAGILTKEENLATYIDKALMSGHLWQPGWEPEGLLSTIPATGTVLLGLLTGMLLNSNQSDEEKVNYMLIGGSVCLAAGLIVDIWFPINKGLWTSSYVLLTGGLALHVLGICYWVIDLKQIKWWTKPFRIFGVNAIAAYVLSGLTAKLMSIISIPGSERSIKEFIYYEGLLPLFSPINASLVFALCYVLLWLGIMWVFYRKRVFIKV